ncbi:MAG: type IV pilus assembly protein PilM [bacterium]|nr:type IV pilus assembly protein PilM [Candidatus Colisoma equi]
MSKKFLTLNIGAATVELAEYEQGAKGALTLLNYGTAHLAAPLDGGNAATILSPAILEIVREKGIKPGPVAVAISGQMAFQRFAAIPMAGGAEKFEQMVRYEIEQNIPFPIDEMVCDRQVVGDTPDGDKQVLIVAAKSDQVEAITDAIAGAGFRVELVDVAPLALVNLVRKARPDEGCCVILDIGAKTTSLVIAEGERIYNRSIPVAGNAITKEIASALGCSPEEAEQAKFEKGYVSLGGVTEDEDEVADRISKVCRAVLTRLNAEISRSINFYRSQQGGSAPVRLYLSGGTALLPQIDAFFAESLGIEVEFLNPTEAIGVGPKVDAAALENDAAFLAATAGLALHFASEAQFAVNLLPQSLVSDRAEKARIPFIAAAGVTLSLGLVLVMLAVNQETAVIVAQRDAVQVRADALANFDKKVTAAQGKVEAAQAGAESFRGLLSSRASAVQRLNAVRDSLLPGMWIEKWADDRIVIRYWKDRIKSTPGKTVGERVVDKLKSRPVVDRDRVRIADMSAVGKDGQVEQVTIEVKFK